MLFIGVTCNEFEFHFNCNSRRYGRLAIVHESYIEGWEIEEFLCSKPKISTRGQVIPFDAVSFTLKNTVMTNY